MFHGINGCSLAIRYAPSTVSALRRHLGIADEPAEIQEAAIRAWLEDHPLTPLMEYSLRDVGLGHLIPRP